MLLFYYCCCCCCCHFVNLLKAALEKVSFVVAVAVAMESGEISTVRLNLLRVPSFLAVNAATSSTGGTCGLPARFGSAPRSAPPCPCSTTRLHRVFVFGYATAAAVDIDLGCGKGYSCPLCPCLPLVLVPPSPLPWSKATHLFT